MYLRLVAVISLFVLSLSLQAFAKSSPADLAQGKKVYTTNCLTCHGEKLDGNGPAGQYLKPKPRNLVSDNFTAGDSKEQIFKTVSEGLPGTAMVGFAHIAQKDREKLVAYILSERASGKKAEAKPAKEAPKAHSQAKEVEKVAKVETTKFTEDETKKLLVKHRCLQCHKENTSLNAPRLHGAPQVYLENQLQAFKKGERRNVFMQTVAAQMNEAEIKALAAHFSQLDRCSVGLDELQGSGDPVRGRKMAATCVACHVQNSAVNAPILDGQSAMYIASQLHKVKSGERPNPFMDAIIKGFSAQDIQDVSSYFGSLNTCPEKTGEVKREQVQWTLPAHLVKRLKKESEERGHSIERLVNAALSAYLGE